MAQPGQRKRTAKKAPAKKAPAKRAPVKGPIRPQGGAPAVAGEDGARQRQHLIDRRAQVEVMHLNGYPMRTIAQQVQVDVHTVFDDIQAIRAEWRAEAAGADLAAQKELELARLERQRTQLAPAAARGVLGAHRELLRIADRKAKLLGLDAPQRLAVEGDGLGIGVHLNRQELAALLTEGTGLDDDNGND